jgi:cupin fold WbuC family metalloprotein
MIPVKTLSPDVYVAQEHLVCVDQTLLASLAAQARTSTKRRTRLCAHKTEEARIHEMFIALDKQVYIRPHRHLNKSESFHVVAGSAAVVFFDDEGAVQTAIEIGDFRSGKPFYYRNEDSRYHTQIITSRRLLVHEITNGPLRREETEYAPWSPPETDLKAARKYMSELRRQIHLRHNLCDRA